MVGVTLAGLAEGMALADRAGLQQKDVLEVRVPYRYRTYLANVTFNGTSFGIRKHLLFLDPIIFVKQDLDPESTSLSDPIFFLVLLTNFC